MKRIGMIAAVAALLASSIAFAQTPVTPGKIGDQVINNLTVQEGITINSGVIITDNVGQPAVNGYTLSPRLMATGGYPAIISTSGTDSTPSTTETYNTEIYVPANVTITGIALFNGSNVTGNVTVGLADSTGAPIAAAKSASTAGSGIDAYQRVPFATPYAAKGPATYFIQVQYSSAIARYNTHHVGNFGCLVSTAQTYGTFASFTPPSTFVADVCNMASLY